MGSTVKTLFLVIIGGMVLSVSSTVIWMYVNRDIGGLTFGHTVSVGPTVITIEDRDARITTLLITEETIITDRLKVLSATDVMVGEFVQVAGERIRRDVIQAKTIRLMRSPRGGRPTPTNEADQ